MKIMASGRELSWPVCVCVCKIKKCVLAIARKKSLSIMNNVMLTKSPLLLTKKDSSAIFHTHQFNVFSWHNLKDRYQQCCDLLFFIRIIQTAVCLFPNILEFQLISREESAKWSRRPHTWWAEINYLHSFSEEEKWKSNYWLANNIHGHKNTHIEWKLPKIVVVVWLSVIVGESVGPDISCNINNA